MSRKSDGEQLANCNAKTYKVMHSLAGVRSKVKRGVVQIVATIENGASFELTLVDGRGKCRHGF